MKFGIEIVPFGEFADPRWVVRLAQAAEEAGWEGLWVWDHITFPYSAGDPWVNLAAAAACTQRLKLLPGVAALPRYLPQNLARLLTGIDILSQGRLILGAGMGAFDDEFSAFGLPGEMRTRASMLDEFLDLLTRLWSGEVVEYQGQHYRASGLALLPQPVQRPHPPVWIGGESRAALRRAARWDGWIINAIDENSVFVLSPEKLQQSISTIHRQRASEALFEVAIDGVSEPGERQRPQEYAAAGATWWFEALFGMRGSGEEMLRRVQAGPPV